MLINPISSLTIKAPIELSRAQCQALVDMECAVAEMGLKMVLLCFDCRKVGVEYHIDGGLDTSKDIPTFSLECSCKRRRYTGADITVPIVISPKIKPRANRDKVKQSAIPWKHYAPISDGEAVLTSLRINTGYTCIRCELEGNATGCGGSKEKGYVISCACSRREYHGHISALSH